jgi:hypothetical protein
MAGCQLCGRIVALRSLYNMADALSKIASAFPLFYLILGPVAKAQTGCALQHTETGVYICYPNPAENPEDTVIHDSVHFSAQGNAPNGKTIGHFKVLIDDHLVYESWATPPTQKLSIETNLNLPFDSGEHTLQLAIDGVGAAGVKGLRIVRPAGVAFCDPFFRADARTCVMSKRTPLQWSLKESPLPPIHPLDEYLSLVDLFAQNLKALEADATDAVAIDAKGNVYVASHVFSDLELRKYAPDSTIVYDVLIRSCGSGFLSVAALAIDDAGRAWIAANTTACFNATSGAYHGDSDQGTQTRRGWVILVDTTKPSALAPVYSTDLSDVAYQITGIRVNEQKDVYLAGTTESSEYPHESFLSITGSEASPSAELGFVSVLNSSGSSLKWSTLLRNAQPTALAVASEGSVYITGRVSDRAPAVTGQKKGVSEPAARNCEAQGKTATRCGNILVAEITDRGRQLPFVARLGGAGDQEGRAISLSPQGDWVLVQGDTDSPDFPVSGGMRRSQGESQQSVIIAMQPCKTGLFDARSISGSASVAPITFGVALDAFAFVFRQRFGPAERAGVVQRPFVSTPIAPACPSDN